MKILLCGKPNVGKSTLFNHLTNKHQKISNWAGTTVGSVSATLKSHKHIEIVDIPGLQEVSYDTTDTSIEQIASNYLLKEDYDLILNVIDISNLENNLLLTLDLLNLKIPTIVVLNMYDVVNTQKISLDINVLEILLGTKVITISAKKKQGLQQLTNLIDNFKYTPSPKLFYGQGIDAQIAQLQTKTDIFNFFKQLKSEKIQLFYQTKARLIRNVKAKCLQQNDYVSITDMLDNVLLNKYFGFPIFIILLFSLFSITLSVGTILQDYFDAMAKVLLVDSTHIILNALSAPNFLNILIAKSMMGSIQVVVSFFPILFVFFFLVSCLEYSGYMARIVFLLYRVMNIFGLNAKSIIPMIISFGCTVPAIMSSRIVENPSQRKLIIFASHFVACSARFSVLILFISIFFKNYGSVILITLYLISIALVLFSAVLFKDKNNTHNEFYVVELPRYQIPPLLAITKSSIKRLNMFINKAAKIIIPVVTVITIANSFTFHGIATSTESEQTILARSGQLITPILHPIGITNDNWSASVAIITGILAKETVVATLQSIYNNETEDANVKVTFKTMKTDFQDANNNLLASILPSKNPPSDSYGNLGIALKDKFSPISAFAFLLFFIIYSPCTAALGSLKSESGTRVMITSFLWSTILGYSIGTLFYQITTIFIHPYSSSLTILIVLSLALIAWQKPFRKRLFHL